MNSNNSQVKSNKETILLGNLELQVPKDRKLTPQIIKWEVSRLLVGSITRELAEQQDPSLLLEMQLPMLDVQPQDSPFEIAQVILHRPEMEYAMNYLFLKEPTKPESQQPQNLTLVDLVQTIIADSD